MQATRATRPNPLSHELAVGFVRTWTLRFPVQDVTIQVMNSALEIKARFKLSYGDAAIVAAARALGCPKLLSEDMAHGQIIADVMMANPFLLK